MGLVWMIVEVVCIDECGNVVVDILLVVLENFVNGYGDCVYYSVCIVWGMVIVGSDELKLLLVLG